MRIKKSIAAGFLAGIVLACFLAFGAQTVELVTFSDISPAQAAALIKEKGSTPLFVLLDVRTAEEFAESRIAGAVNVDVRGDDFKKKIEELNREAAYVVYCRGGVRSARAMGLMKEWGFKLVYNLAGGLMNWQNEKMPLETGPVTRKFIAAPIG